MLGGKLEFEYGTRKEMKPESASFFVCHSPQGPSGNTDVQLRMPLIIFYSFLANPMDALDCLGERVGLKIDLRIDSLGGNGDSGERQRQSGVGVMDA